MLPSRTIPETNTTFGTCPIFSHSFSTTKIGFSERDSTLVGSFLSNRTTPGLKTPAHSKSLLPGRMIGSAEMRCHAPQGGVWLFSGKATIVKREIKAAIFRREFGINVDFEVRFRSDIAVCLSLFQPPVLPSRVCDA